MLHVRALCAALVACATLAAVGGSAAASGFTSEPVLVGPSETFKTSDTKRAKRAAWVAAATTPEPSLSYADQVLARTNAERTSRGLQPLSFSRCADGFADDWAVSLAKAGSLSHQPLSPILSTCGARAVGENVAYGNVTAEALVQMWMDSPGHRANILNSGFTHLGVGDVHTSTGRVYAVQVFLTL